MFPSGASLPSVRAPKRSSEENARAPQSQDAREEQGHTGVRDAADATPRVRTLEHPSSAARALSYWALVLLAARRFPFKRDRDERWPRIGYVNEMSSSPS